MEITKFLFGSTSETYSDDDDGGSGKQEICENFNTGGEEVSPRKKWKIISHRVSTSANEHQQVMS